MVATRIIPGVGVRWPIAAKSPFVFRGVTFWLVLSLFLVTGCTGKPIENLGVGRLTAMPAGVPTYGELAAAQNARVAKVERYWTAIRSRLRWYDDEKEKWREESGEGHLILERPYNVALTFSKVGEIGFWAGSNEEEYWVFEGGDERRVYVGRNENAFQPCADPLPIGVHPLEMIDLSGLFPFPVFDDAGADRMKRPTVGYSALYGAWKIDLPGRWSVRRVYLDVETLLPSRVELRSRLDVDIIITEADLPTYVRQRVMGLDKDDEPWVPSKFVLRQMGVGGEVTLEAFRPSDRTGNGPIRPEVFQFKAVARVMKPKWTQVLDVRCGELAKID